MPSSRSLDDALKLYRALNLCCSEAMDAVNRNLLPFSRKFAAATETTGQHSNDLRKFFADFFDNQVTPTLFEICFLDVVRTFECMAHELVKNASGNIKDFLKSPRFAKDAKKSKFPFQSYADKFVKERGEDIRNPGDLRNLGDVKEILKDRLHKPLYDKVDVIVDYRNWLAHGNRFSQRPSHPGSLPDVVVVLRDVLTEIKG